MHYDIIIIGGGLVGASFAQALRDTSLKVALVDAKLPSQNDARLFALNYGSCQLLKNMCIWQDLVDKATPIHQVHVSHQGYFGAMRLRRDDVKLATLGYVIPAKYIEASLNQHLARGNCTIYRPATLTHIVQHEQHAALTLEMEHGVSTITGTLIIGADGTHSTVREQMNIECELFDYQQSAIVTRTQLTRSHHHVAYERFTHDGSTIAMLPLFDKSCATIWTLPHEKALQYQQLSDSEYTRVLQQAFGYRLGKLVSIDQRFMYPIKMLRANNHVSGHLFLLGNAAHTLHPVAAQGFNLALYEVAILIDGIQSLRHKRLPITALALQTIYANSEKHQSRSIQLSHRLPQLFTNQSKMFSIAVQFGMIGLDLATPLKQKLLQTIMGRQTPIPSLLL